MEKVMQSKCQWMAVNRIKTRMPFNSLFPVDDKTVEAVAEFNNVGKSVLPDSFDEEDDLKEGLFQILSEVIEGQDRFCQKVTDLFDGKAPEAQPESTTSEA